MAEGDPPETGGFATHYTRRERHPGGSGAQAQDAHVERPGDEFHRGPALLGDEELDSRGDVESS